MILINSGIDVTLITEKFNCRSGIEPHYFIVHYKPSPTPVTWLRVINGRRLSVTNFEYNDCPLHMTWNRITCQSHDSRWDHMITQDEITCQTWQDVYLMLVSCWPCCPSVLISSWMLIPWSNKQLDMVFSTCVCVGGGIFTQNTQNSRWSTNTQHAIFEGITGVHVLFYLLQPTYLLLWQHTHLLLQWGESSIRSCSSVWWHPSSTSSWYLCAGCHGSTPPTTHLLGLLLEWRRLRMERKEWNVHVYVAYMLMHLLYKSRKGSNWSISSQGRKQWKT